MSISNFWNNFTHGFMHGMFNNNPFFGCGFNNWGCFGGFMPFSCGYNTIPTSLFLVPNIMNFSLYPMMPESMPPTFNVFSMNQDSAKMFPDELWQVPSVQNCVNDSNSNIFADTNWGDYFTKMSDSSPTPKSTMSQTTLKGGNNQYDGLIQKYATKYGVEARLVKALMKQESGFNPNAKSGAGAIGLMQLMPDTAREMGAQNPYDPEQNIEAGVKYLKKMLDRYNGNKELAVAAYNAGPGNVKNGKIPQNGETPKHVREVMKNYREMA